MNDDEKFHVTAEVTIHLGRDMRFSRKDERGSKLTSDVMDDLRAAHNIRKVEILHEPYGIMLRVETDTFLTEEAIRGFLIPGDRVR